MLGVGGLRVHRAKGQTLSTHYYRVPVRGRRPSGECSSREYSHICTDHQMPNAAQIMFSNHNHYQGMCQVAVRVPCSTGASVLSSSHALAHAHTTEKRGFLHQVHAQKPSLETMKVRYNCKGYVLGERVQPEARQIRGLPSPASCGLQGRQLTRKRQVHPNGRPCVAACR